ncbi:MAG: nitrite reductase/ring-hydroxylating ferredoxin subunit [Woeseiaceae bacterium]
MIEQEIEVGRFDELGDPGCREFRIGEGDWPFKGFVVRKGNQVFAYQNYCMHVGHPLNWQPDSFLTADGSQIVCASHGAIYEIDSGVCVSGPCPGRVLRAVAVEVKTGMVVVRGPAGA